MAGADGDESGTTGEDAREQRSFIKAVLCTMHQPLVVLDADLRVVSANRAFYDTFRTEAAQTEGVRIFDIGDGWDIPELRRLLDEVIPGDGDVSDYKVEHEFKAIGRRIMVLNAQRMRRKGRDDLILLAVDDITEREDARRRLAAQKEFVDKIFDASREAILILGRDLRVKAANETFYDMFKVDPSQTEGRRIYDIGDGQWNIRGLRNLLEDVLPDNNAFNDYEVEHDFDTIGRRIMVLNARRVDQVDFILLAIEDQTEARRISAELMESETKFRVLIESTAVAHWEADPEGRLFESPSWCAFTGQSAEEMRGEGWLDALHPADRKRALRAWRDCVAAGEALGSRSGCGRKATVGAGHAAMPRPSAMPRTGS